MKKLYTIMGVLILSTLLVVGCSSDEGDKNLVDEPTQSEEDIKDNEEEAGDEVEEEESEEEVAGKSQPEVKSQVLKNIIDSKKHTIKMKVYSLEENLLWLVDAVVADGKSASTMDLEGSLVRTIEKDDKIYTVMEETETIIVSGAYEEDEEMGTPSGQIIYDNLVYMDEGKDTFLGNERDYEEYKTDTGKVRYFFDGDKLDGLQVFTYEEASSEDEDINIEDSGLLIDVEYFEDEADIDAFELPEGYKVIGE